MVSRAVRPADATVEGGPSERQSTRNWQRCLYFYHHRVPRNVRYRRRRCPRRESPPQQGALEVLPATFRPPGACVPAGRDRRSAAVKEGACWSPSRALLRSGPRGPDARRIVEGRIRRTVRLRRGGAGSRCRPGLRPGGFLRGTTSARSRECLPGSVQGSLPRPPE